MATEPTDPHARTATRDRKLLERRTEIIAQFADDPAVRAWLTQFRDDGKGFMEKYAEKLAEVFVDGQWPYEHQQAEAAKLRQEAVERLWEIQQRKLLLLQCRWRANEIKLPADFVELTTDFDIWGHRIHECPHLPPITPAEVEDYIEYLLSDFCRDADSSLSRPHGWQDYRRYKHWHILRAEGINPARVRDGATENQPRGLAGLMGMMDAFFLDYPRYYRWRDERDGPPNLLLLLPDERGEREHYFGYFGHHGHAPEVDLTDDEDAAEEETASAPVAPAAPPKLDPHDDAQLERLLRLEAPELLPYHRAYVQPPVELTAEEEETEDEEDDDEDDAYDDEAGDHAADRWHHDPEAAREAADELLAIPERIPIRAAADWREGVIRAWVDWRKRQLATLLREEFAAYQARETAGQPHPPVYKAGSILDTLREVRQERLEQILTGRERAGFPRDLNF